MEIPGERLHLERGAHHDEQVALWEVARRQREESLGQLLSEEDNVLNQGNVSC